MLMPVPCPMNTRLPLVLASTLTLLLVGLSPKPAAAQSAANARATVEAAEATVQRGRPDYALLRQALAQAEATDDLLLKARANFLQARADSAANRRSKAGPLFRRAEQLTAQAAANDYEAEIATLTEAARVEVEAANAATAERDRVAAELAEQESAATAKLLTAIGIALAIIAALIIGWLASVRKLRGDVKKARLSQERAEEGFAEARQQMTGAAKASMQRLRHLLKHYRTLIPAGEPGSGTSLLAAHDAALSAMVQSSFDSGASYEMATESFFDKFKASAAQLTSGAGGRLSVESMPLRLPLDQSIPFALLVTELVAYAFAQGSTSAKAVLTKEGENATLTVVDESGRQQAGAADGAALKYARQLAEELGGKLATETSEAGAATRLKFAAVPGRTGGQAAANV